MLLNVKYCEQLMLVLEHKSLFPDYFLTAWHYHL